ncbi:hypothetical protein [Microbacterium esteraromaticum]|uniref:hypothetical protein n=1 Tax=Microbacterium esteraromaticum TaxID=57043 RepID=UPI00118010D0|nr:hypothetical protein [Microbacterium esteraromaticum]
MEAHEKVRVGVPFSDVRNWVVELDGKRMGMITVNKNSFHLRLEVRWLTHRQPDVYLQRFQEVFGNDHRFSAEEKAVFIAKIGPDEGEFVDRLARFWLQLIDDELETQKLPATRRAPAATALGLDQ